MRVYITVDIEGIAGVVNSEEGARGNPEYERARRLMTAEASAVVAGIFDADPSAEVAVADVHATYRNLIPEELDERAKLIRGKPRSQGMVHGLDGSYDVAMLVGMHGRAGTMAVLSHTFTRHILDVKVNGKSYGELGLNAAVAGSHGVPVILVAGDQAVAEEARDALGSEVVTVEVKRVCAHLAAETLHPRVAREKLRAAAARAIRERPDVPPLKMATPVEVEVALARPVYADLTELIDNVERVDANRIRFARPDYLSAYRVLRLIVVLCGTVE